MKEYDIKTDENGTTRYFKPGTTILHREDGPAMEVLNGDKYWYQDGKCHRTDGPAIEYANGDKVWYQNDILHRTDGPTITNVDGYKAWFIDGNKLTEKEFNIQPKPEPTKQPKTLTRSQLKIIISNAYNDGIHLRSSNGDIYADSILRQLK